MIFILVGRYAYRPLYRPSELCLLVKDPLYEYSKTLANRNLFIFRSSGNSAKAEPLYMDMPKSDALCEHLYLSISKYLSEPSILLEGI